MTERRSMFTGTSAWLDRGLKQLRTPRSLRYQLLSRSLLILLGLLVLIGVFQYFIMQSFMYKNKAQSIKDQIASIPGEFLSGRIANGNMSGGYPSPNGGGSRENPGSRLFVPGLSLAYYSLNGELTVLTEDTAVGTTVKLNSDVYQRVLQERNRPDKTFYKIVTNSVGTEQMVVLVPVRARGHITGVMQASTQTWPLKQVLIRQLVIFMSLSLLALVVGLLTFQPILKKTLVPLSTIVDKVGKINAGNLDERLPGNQGQLEIDRLSASFNGMLQRLEASFEAEKEAREQMRRFIADASHELRTPLTSIHGFLEVLLRGAAANPEQLNRSLKSMYGESERINKLVQDLLLLAKLDRSPTARLEEGSVDAVLHDMEPQFRLLAGERKLRLSIAPHVIATFDRDKLKQVVLNLFHNAVQHTDPVTGMVEVFLDRKNNGFILGVQDNGPGIPEEHLPHLFERFYRVDSSRTRRNGGSGLGLSITKSIIDLHHGSIQVASSPGEGSVFVIWLPNDPGESEREALP